VPRLSSQYQSLKPHCPVVGLCWLYLLYVQAASGSCINIVLLMCYVRNVYFCWSCGSLWFLLFPCIGSCWMSLWLSVVTAVIRTGLHQTPAGVAVRWLDMCSEPVNTCHDKVFLCERLCNNVSAYMLHPHSCMHVWATGKVVGRLHWPLLLVGPSCKGRLGAGA